MHVRRALALAVAGPLLLAGCTGDPEPSPNIPDPSPSSPSPTATESETPEVESAEDFIRRWAVALEDMQETGDTTAFRKLGPDCDSCSAAADRVQGVYEAGGRIEWDGWEIISIRPIGKSSTEFRAVIDSAPTRIQESPKGEWQKLPGGRVRRLLVLQQTDDGWLMSRTAEQAS